MPKLILKPKHNFISLYLIEFLFYLPVLIEEMVPRKVQMQDAAIMQHKIPTTPAP